MGRSPPKGPQTWDRVLAAAPELVSERGVRATSLDDVREAAALSKSQLSHYFDDKADVRAVVCYTTGQVFDAQQPELHRLDKLGRDRGVVRSACRVASPPRTRRLFDRLLDAAPEVLRLHIRDESPARPAVRS